MAAPLMVGRALETTASAAGVSTGGDAVLSEKDVNVLGVSPGTLGSPRVVEGSQLAKPDEIVADESLHLPVGATVRLNGSMFKVVGLVNGVTYFAGQPVVIMEIGSLDDMVASGLPVASAVLVTGVPKAAVPGFATLDDADVRADLNRPVAQAEKTIKLVEVLLWVVAAGIIVAIIYLSAIERRNDFAVLRAVGTPSWHLFLGLVVQAVVMALGAVAIAIGVEAAIAPTSAMAVRLSGADYAAVPILAVVVGIVASVLPARRAATVDPALAFGAGNSAFSKSPTSQWSTRAGDISSDRSTASTWRWSGVSSGSF